MTPALEWLFGGSRPHAAGIHRPAHHTPKVSGLTAGHSRGDEGAVALLTVISGLVVAALALAVILAAAGVGVGAARARTAADAAALAAMAASPVFSGGGRPEHEAARVASANGARLVEVDAAGWPLRVRVTVEVQPRRELEGMLMPPLRAHATAAARPSG
ncbi:MAG: hypothetical protein ACRDZ4_16165 [Egibacteraceae bacterium]